jgi:uncharacterized repeat protein (TIGR01451 family)
MRRTRTVAFVALVAILGALALGPLASAQDIPPSWTPPEITKTSSACGDPGDPVTYTIVVINPTANDDGSPNQATWYNVRMIDEVPADLRIDAVALNPPTIGTITVTGNTVVVDGGITLAPGQGFSVYIEATVLTYPPPQLIENEACVEYTDDTGAPQGPICQEEPTVLVPCTEIVPEASTLILLGTAATGLAGYVGVQIRARRRNRS